MEKLNDNKAAIVTAIIVAVLTFALTSFFGSWNKIDDVVTQEDMFEYVDKHGENILDRAKKYTDYRVEGIEDAYRVSTQHIEKMIDSHFQVLNDRLDRIDERMKGGN